MYYFPNVFLRTYIICIRRTTYFPELILYPATLLQLSISCMSSLTEFLKFFVYTLISSLNSNSINSFPMCNTLISFCCLTVIARISSTRLNSYWRIEQSFLDPDFTGIVLSFSTFNLELAIGLLQISFLCLDMYLVSLFDCVFLFDSSFSGSLLLIFYDFYFTMWM